MADNSNNTEEAGVASTVDSSSTCPGNSSTAVAESVEMPSSNAGDQVPDSKTPPEKDLVVEAVQHLQQGKRHMIVSDYKSAVPCFEHACKLLDSCYGPGSSECGEAYLHYGSALFELARLEEGLMGGVVNVENQLSSDEDEEGNEDEEEEADAEAEGDEEQENADANEAEAKALDNEAAHDDKVDIDLTQPSTSKGEASVSASAGNGEKSDEEEEADLASNDEIAWEVLSLAKEIFESGELNKENRLNLAEVLQKLGEISIDWENNENAVHLLNQCLEHRKAVLEADDRLIALTYHYLGIAFSFKKEIDKANSCFESALDVIQLRIKHLKEASTDGMDNFELDLREREIKQLEDLIPELQAKIEDLKEQMHSQFKTLESLQKETENEEQQEIKQAQVAQDKPVNNISHLIKRKKEADNDSVTENGAEVTSKKARIDVNTSTNSIADSTEATD